MNAGARKATPGPTNALMRVGGAALAVALLATVVILLVFGDRLAVSYTHLTLPTNREV